MKQLDHLKSMVEWGEEARRACQEELAAGERENDILSRFKLEDDMKFKVNLSYAALSRFNSKSQI